MKFQGADLSGLPLVGELLIGSNDDDRTCVAKHGTEIGQRKSVSDALTFRTLVTFRDPPP